MNDVSGLFKWGSKSLHVNGYNFEVEKRRLMTCLNMTDDPLTQSA